MIYHAHWLQHNLEPMPIWFHFNGDGDCKFSIGGSDSSDERGIGKCSFNDDGSVSLLFRNNLDHERKFKSVDDFGWGLYEPEEAINKWKIGEHDEFFLWEVESDF